MIRSQLLSVLLLFVFQISFADIQGYRNIELTSLLQKEGLEQNYITCTIQDDEGFLWVGTPGGLFQYDGNEFISIPVTSGNQVIRIHFFFKDQRGDVWISTSYGLYVYRVSKRKIVAPHQNQSWGHVNVIHQQNDSIYWLGNTNGELVRYNQADNTDHKFKFAGKAGLKTILPLNENSLLLGFNYGGGCIRFNTHTQQSEYSILSDAFLNASFQLTIQSRSHHHIIVCSNGIFQLKPDDQVKCLGETCQDGLDIPSDIISMVEVNDSILWLGTDGKGLYEYNFNTNRYVKIKTQESILVLAITSLYQSQDGLVWLGTTNQGLILYEPQRTWFKHWHYEKGNTSGLSYSSVLCMTEMGNGNIFVGLDGGGGNVFNQEEHQFIHFPSSFLDARFINSAWYGQGNMMWLGGYNSGVKCFRVEGDSILRQQQLPLDLPLDCAANCIIEDREKNVWIGTGNYGVFLFDVQQNALVNLVELVDNDDHHLVVITALYESSDLSLWIGTPYGLYKYDRIQRKLDKLQLTFEGQSAAYVSTIIETPEKELLIGTKNGLWRIGNNGQVAGHLTNKDGLIDNRVKGILQDDSNNLWMATGQGISLFNGALQHIRNFDDSDGIHGEFNDNASIKTRDGHLYFGGTNGIYSCHQDEVYTNTHVPPVVIKSINIHDYQQAGVYHPIHIFKEDEVTLSSKQNVFTIDFVALNYTLSEKNTYAYQLEGYDRTWITKTGVHNVTYTNIPPGKYVFTVKAANNDGLWNKTGRSLKIRIKPPWYKSVPALILWLVLFFVAVLIVNRYILLQLRLKDALKMEKADKLKQIEINQNKLQFFTNITHELRAPLSLIMGPVDTLLKNEVPYSKKYEQLKLVSKHSHRLFKLINQILEFRKVEHAAKQLTVTKVDVIRLLKEIFESYQDLAAEKNMHLSFQSTFDKLYLWLDVGMMEIIVHNLLSNAVKFTPENGTVDLIFSVNTASKKVEIMVKDSGVGIKKEDVNRIFDRFYQSKNALTTKQGTGIGLSLLKSFVQLLHGTIDVESTPKKGSAFTVSLKLGRSHYKANELAEDGLSKRQHLKEAECNAVNKELPTRAEVDADKNSNRHCVLIVEDEDDLRHYMQSELKPVFKVYTASDGQEAFSMAQSLLPDLVVSDVQMPRMSGLALCKKLKNNFPTSHIPVILLTALGADEDHKEGLRIGADDYLVKPFGMEVLSLKIKNLLASRQKLIERFKTEEIVQLSELGIGVADEEFLNTVIEIIHAHISEQSFKVDQLIVQLGMSRSLFYKKIKSITGSAPADFIRYVRLKCAAKLLVSSSLSITEIAYEVGFSSLKHFRDRFKIQYGLAPSQYAEQQRKIVDNDT